jgi:glucosamine--fructose-6-phosphate aminotransferase (isomerizing)
MCGIVGMIGKGNVLYGTVEKLSKIEYRGYDSYGFAFLNETGINMMKEVGSVSRALASGRLDLLEESNVALAHTRWATHGRVTDKNAHPHVSYDSKVAIVHNGVIVNHIELRTELESSGIAFKSETDSEVIAHLIARFLENGISPIEAIYKVTKLLVGEYALGILLRDYPNNLYGAKKKSPLLVANNEECSLLASDRIAAINVGTTVTFLEDDDIICLSPGNVEIYRPQDEGVLIKCNRESVQNQQLIESVDKSGYPHYMLKEINETPQAIQKVINMPSDEFRNILPKKKGTQIALVGAGSAYYVSLMGQYLLKCFSRLPSIAVPSDEGEHLTVLEKDDVVIAVSQSGETFDTLEFCRNANTLGAKVVSICNVPGSTQEQISFRSFRQDSGPEICVLSTKSVVSQITILSRIALEHGRHSGAINDEIYSRELEALNHLPKLVASMLSETDAVQEIANKWCNINQWFFIGRGVLFPVALESALKFKEVSYHHAEGMSAGFFKHGTISLIDENFYTVALLPSKVLNPEQYSATLASVSEIVARNGPVIGIGPSDIDQEFLSNFVDYISLPYQNAVIADVILQIVTGQLLAYFCALKLGRDIDQPRSLAKSVTVR